MPGRRWTLFFILASVAQFSAVAFPQELDRFAATLRSGSVEEKREALFQIRNLRSAEASRTAAAALSDKEPIVRATAASAVIFMPSAEAAAALAPMLADRDEFVRREAAYALGEAGDPSAAGPLSRSLTRDKSGEVRTAAAAALGKLGSLEAVGALVSALDGMPREENEMLRRAAARSIGQNAQIMRSGKVKVVTPQNFLPDKYKDIDMRPSADLIAAYSRAVKKLLLVLDDRAEADDTRREAAFALGAIGDRSAEAILTKYAASDDVYMAEIAKEALIKLRAVE